ncbi:hypothetical protein [Thermus hydrothermalis]|uniref:hypothetical protein n=1 Tax=Thermus hydrothermalis TaxID=2908148 RepID=UPI001FA9B4F2|nr:hypothetical protein [Thermus hydrothermalis]
MNNLEYLLEAWKEAQRTITELDKLLMQIRSFAVLVATAVVTAAATLGSREDGLRLMGGLLMSAAIPWIAIYLLDRYYYHILLVGAVSFAEEIEKKTSTRESFNEDYLKKSQKCRACPFYACKVGS